MCTMALGALSVCLTVLVLNLHHRDHELPVPAWAHILVLDYLASLLCVAGNHLQQCTSGITKQAVATVDCNQKVSATRTSLPLHPYIAVKLKYRATFIAHVRTSAIKQKQMLQQSCKL